MTARRSHIVLAASGFFLLSAGMLLEAVQRGGPRRVAAPEPISLPGGARVEFPSFEAETLGGSQSYSIFLPPSYFESDRDYPVIYFLHGLNNDHTSWTMQRYGGLHRKVEQLMLAGKLVEFLMVHPDGENSFYCNHADGIRRYEDFVRQELVARVESRYRVRSDRSNRALAGTSMGGYGALKIAMKFPGRYGAVVGHSPIIFLGRNPLDVPEAMKTTRYFRFFEQLLKPLFGVPLQQELWDANNALRLAGTAPLEHLNIYFDYGTADRYIRTIRLDEGVRSLHRVLEQAGVSHTFKVHPDEGHGWALVAAHMEESLRFLTQTFD